MAQRRPHSGAQQSNPVTDEKRALREQLLKEFPEEEALGGDTRKVPKAVQVRPERRTPLQAERPARADRPANERQRRGDRSAPERRSNGARPAGNGNVRPASGKSRRETRPEDSRQRAADRAAARRKSMQSAGRARAVQNSNKRKNRRGKNKRVFTPGFRKGFLIAWGAFVLLLIIAMVLLSSALRRYESGLPEHYMNEIISAVRKGDLQELHLTTADDISIEDPSLFVSAEQISQFIKEKSEAEPLSYVKVNAESTENENVYIIRSGEEKLLKVFLDRNEENGKTENGWHEAKTQMAAEGLQIKELMIQIPSAASLEIDQRPVDRALITEAGNQIRLLSNLINAGIIGDQPTVDTYVVRGIFADPEIVMIDEYGNRSVCSEADGVYTGGFAADEAFSAEQTARVLGMFEPYAKYFSGDAGRDALSAVMLDRSPAYNSAVSADVSWMQAHDGISLSGQIVENIRKYSDQCYSCDISFREDILQGGASVRTWDTNMTWIMVFDGNYYLADFVTKTAND